MTVGVLGTCPEERLMSHIIGQAGTGNLVLCLHYGTRQTDVNGETFTGET